MVIITPREAFQREPRRFVVIPTRGINPTLVALVEAASKVATPIIIHPNPHAKPVPGDPGSVPLVTPKFKLIKTVNLVRDSHNFQRWGNLGFKKAMELGGEGSLALMINDDIKIDSDALESIFEQMESLNADVICMDDRPMPALSPMTGWLFGVRVGSIWMDESFVWWYGDDDFWNRAEKQGLTIATVSAPYSHNRGDKGSWDPIFDPVAAADEQLYYERWHGQGKADSKS